MNWSHVLTAEHRHAALLAEAANRRLAGGHEHAAGGTAPAAPDRSRRSLLPWRPAVAR